MTTDAKFCAGGTGWGHVNLILTVDANEGLGSRNYVGEDATTSWLGL